MNRPVQVPPEPVAAPTPEQVAEATARLRHTAEDFAMFGARTIAQDIHTALSALAGAEILVAGWRSAAEQLATRLEKLEKKEGRP